MALAWSYKLSEQFKCFKGLGLSPELCQSNFCIQRIEKKFPQDLATKYGSKYSPKLTQTFEKMAPRLGSKFSPNFASNLDIILV